MTTARSLWPRKSVVVLSFSANTTMYLREILRSLGWVVVKSTSQSQVALACLREKEAVALIIDDDSQQPSGHMIRNLVHEPILYATPVLLFLLEHHKHEKFPLESMGFRFSVA